MLSNYNLWELAEAVLAGTLSEADKAELNSRLENDQEFAAAYGESLQMVKSLETVGKQKKFKKLVQDIHAEQNKVIKKNLFTQVIALPGTFWKTAGVAASVALLTSAITYWTITPSIKKNDSQYNKISREVEHIKTGLKDNTDAIENIKKNNQLNVPPASDVRFTGTGFAITNDGYFVTAWHVVNQGKFDSVFIFNNEGEYYKASLVRQDEKADIALLKVEKKNFHFGKSDVPYTIAKSKSVIGAHIYSIGYPKDNEVYSEGYVSSKNGFNGDNLQYTLELPATKGQSGAPVIDLSGNIIGMLTAIGSQGESNTYAVSTKSIVDLIEKSHLASKVHFSKSNRLRSLTHEKQVEKLEDYTFSVKVYKK